MSISLQFASLYDRQEVSVWSNCLLELGSDFLVRNMVFVRDAYDLALFSDNVTFAVQRWEEVL